MLLIFLSVLRVTLYLLEIENKDSFFQVAESYGLTPRQLSATYAAEVSQAAKILGTQSGLSKRARKSICIL